MSETGFTKLYHPRGPLVTLPVPSDPKEAFAHIANCLDAGWLVAAPGLGEGEQKEDVGYILRGLHEADGETTPYLLLYSTNEGHSYSFLKVYLNCQTDIDAFERASGMRLTELREYAGNDKPERGKSARLDAYIMRMTRPLGVILKANPKYKESDREAAAKRNELYKIPRRLFVRWSEEPSAAPPIPDVQLAAKHLQVLECYTAATTQKRLDDCRVRAKQLEFTAEQVKDQDSLYESRKKALSAATTKSGAGK